MNCGIYTITQAEAYLHSQILVETDPNELRAIYIQRLIQQFFNAALSTQKVNVIYEQSFKKRTHVDNIKVGVVKKAQPLFLDIPKTTYDDRCRNLEELGPNWTEFYATQIESSRLSSDELYNILTLACTIGSSEVLLEIADMYRSFSGDPNRNIKISMVAKAYWLYNKAGGLIMKTHTQQRLLVIYLYKKYKALNDHYKQQPKELKKRGRQKGNQAQESTKSRRFRRSCCSMQQHRC